MLYNNTKEWLYLARLQEQREKEAQLRGPPKIDPDVAVTTVQKASYVASTIAQIDKHTALYM